MERHIFMLVTWILCPLIYALHHRGMAYETERMIIGFIILLIGMIFTWNAKRSIKPMLIAAENGQRKLVTKGIFAVSRHPLYVCQSIIVIAMVTMFPSIFSIIILLFYLWSNKITMSEEETKMIELFGKKYKRYKEKVPIIPIKFWKLLLNK